MGEAVSEPETNSIPPPVGVDRDTFTLAWLACHEGECSACGYNLRALTTPRCPECGEPVTVRLVLTDAPSAAWITLLLTTAFGARIGLILFAALIKQGDPREYSIRLILGYFMAHLPALALVYMVRRWFCRRGKALQIRICVVALLQTAGMIVWFLERINR